MRTGGGYYTQIFGAAKVSVKRDVYLMKTVINTEMFKVIYTNQ